ncbi:MAG: polyprenyl synthetase family protein [Clostridiaceae bacterium]|nr:polyprenyl synthetase family protein [Clostridiaceae bacterium]
MDYKEIYQNYTEIIENWLNHYTAYKDCPEKVIYESMNYSLLAGGKRLRPVLSLAVCDLIEGDYDDVLPFACALEMIHNYSLIHDDLPCMDNDDFRRGKPTNHRVFGQAIAVLAGDGLLNRAFELMLEEVSKDDKDCYLRSKAALLIAKAAGTSGMIGGQVIDIKSEGRHINQEELLNMHKKKTGALIKASILFPAELYDTSVSIKKCLSDYAENIGLAFQIKDDILDHEGNISVVGKPTGSDTKNNKSTFVTLMGLDTAKELLREKVNLAVKALENVNNSDFLIKTAYFIADRDK